MIATLRLCLMLVLFGLIAPVVMAGELTPQQQRDVLTEAQQFYDRGIALLRSNPPDARNSFHSAAERFELVAGSGVKNGRLFYNLANAYLQSGDVGRAILNYRRALRLMPGDARVQSNLHYARSLCKNQIAPSGERALSQALLSWHHATSLRSRFRVFAASYIAFWLALMARPFWPSNVRLVVAGVLGLTWLVLGVSVASSLYGWGRRPAGVITNDNVIVRKGNGIGYEPQFEQPMSAGVEFEVIEPRGEWMNIELPDGKNGWIESRQAELVP